MPEQKAESSVLLRDGALAVNAGGREAVAPLAASEAGGPPKEGAGMPRELAALARLFAEPVPLRAWPNGEARLELSPVQVAGLPSGCRMEDFGMSRRFLDVPVRVGQIWSAPIAAGVPGVVVSTTQARFTLEAIDIVEESRWARVSVRAESVLNGGPQPVFGCTAPLRVERLRQDLMGTFQFAVDQGRTERQDMEMVLSMGAEKLTPAGAPAGKVELEMDVRVQLERLPVEPAGREGAADSPNR
jgi:hypothetical protein